MLDELNPFRSAKDYQGGIRHIEALMASVDDPELRWALEYTKQVFLEWDGQHDKAIENARRLLTQDNVSNARREDLLGRESFNLFRLKRFEEAYAHCDRRIAAAKDDPKKRLELIGWKSQMAAGHGMPQQRLAIHTEYLEATTQGSDDWSTAMSFIADTHNKLGDREAELHLLNQLLAAQKDSPSTKLRLIDCCLALNDNATARQLIEDLINDVSLLADSPRKGDRDQHAYFQKQIELFQKTINLRRKAIDESSKD